MPQYLVCNYLPDDFDPSTVTEALQPSVPGFSRLLIVPLAV